MKLDRVRIHLSKVGDIIPSLKKSVAYNVRVVRRRKKKSSESHPSSARQVRKDVLPVSQN